MGANESLGSPTLPLFWHLRSKWWPYQGWDQDQRCAGATFLHRHFPLAHYEADRILVISSGPSKCTRGEAPGIKQIANLCLPSVSPLPI